MRKKLEEQYTWVELFNHIFPKIKRKLKPSEHTQFKKWFMKRECVGYFFDPVMILRCFRIWQDLQKDLDHFVVISGREGFGKTTFSFQIASWVNPNFNLDNVAYGVKRYLDIMHRKQKEIKKGMLNITKIPTESIVLDEGTELLSRESLNLSNRILTKSFFVQRALKFLVITNVPNFFMIDVVMRLHRVRTLIDVIGRGKYKAITGKGIRLVAEYGMKTKSISSARIPDGSFWHGSFNKSFPKSIDKKEYDCYKLESIGELLESMKDDSVKQKMISTVRVAKELGCKPETVKNMIRRGEVEGKLIGGRHYLTRRSYDKLMTL